MDYLWLREKSSVAFTTKKILQDIAEVIERLPAFSSEYVIKVDHLVLRRPDRAKTILFQKLFKCFQVSTKICNDVMVMWVFMGAVFFPPVVQKTVALYLNQAVPIGRFEPSSWQTNTSSKEIISRVGPRDVSLNVSIIGGSGATCLTRE